MLQQAQLTGEICTTHIEDTIKLCRLVIHGCLKNKVGHVLEWIAEDVYMFLISKDNLNSTTDVFWHSRVFEALNLCIITLKFGQLANVTSIVNIDATATMSMANMIRQIVHGELL